MIGSLHGTIELVDTGSIIINVNGVGYRVHVPQSVLTSHHLGQEIVVYTYMHIREDILDLYGFVHREDLRLFELLLGVNGIGPKTALGIFSLGQRSTILSAIGRADVQFFTGVPRLGTKNVQKIIIELKNKVGSVAELDLSGSDGGNEVAIALREFGFKEKEIAGALEAVHDIEDPGKKITMALKYLGK